MSVKADDRQQDDLATFQNGGLSGDTEHELFSQHSSENTPVKEGRVIRKAKRLTDRHSPKKDDQGNGLPGTIQPANGNSTKQILPYTKNSRKSRNARGRGLPKKGGAGGKGTWGAPGSELYEEGECRDSHDPNYDSDSQDPIVVSEVEPPVSNKELAKAVEPILQEYLEHGDTKEAIDMLEKLNLGRSIRHKVLEIAVSLAMDRHDPQRELTSRLLADLHGNILTQAAMAKGFDELLQNLADLTLDTPDAPVILGQFIARALADDCLPSNLLESYKGVVDEPNVKDALEKAEVLVSLNHGIHKMDSIWGIGGGNRPVKYLTNKMILLLKEYLSSGDVYEATRCLKELDVPHFHHEMVYQSAVICIEESTDRTADMIVVLLKSLTASMLISPDQFNKGLKRLFDDMPDVCLDVPAAYAWLERLGNKLFSEGIMGETIYKELPVRGRKRFVSEGDGGKVKPEHQLQ